MGNSENAVQTDDGCTHCTTQKQALQARFTELAVLQRLYVRLEAKNKELTGQLQQSATRANKLTDQLHAERLARTVSEARLAKIHASKFWRLTAPLRALVRMLRPR